MHACIEWVYSPSIIIYLFLLSVFEIFLESVSLHLQENRTRLKVSDDRFKSVVYIKRKEVQKFVDAPLLVSNKTSSHQK